MCKMSKVKLAELQEGLDKAAGFTTVKESQYDRQRREILDIKIICEAAQGTLNELKGLPRGKSPVLCEKIQQDLNDRAHEPDSKRDGKVKTDRDLLLESQWTYNATTRCIQCGWIGKVTLKRGERVGNASCPECGVSPGVLIREAQRASVRSGDIIPARHESLQDELDGRAAELREAGVSVISDEVLHISLREAAYDGPSHQLETILEGAPAEAASSFLGMKMFINRPTHSQRKERPEGNLKDWASTIMESRAEGDKIHAVIAVHDSWLQERLVDPVAASGMRIDIEMRNDQPVGIYWLVR
jgi:hypothetical protein